MARSINDYYNFCLYVVRKERGVFLSISEFNQNMDAGQMDAFEDWFKPYGVNQEVHDALRPFREYETFTSNSSGYVNFQSDYLHLLGTPFTIYGSSVTKPTWINEDEFPFASTSQQRPVTNDYPLMVDTGTGFSIYPQTTQIGAYWYLRRPRTPQLVVTTVGRVITYDSVNSIQLEWNEAYINNILAKALKYSGINMNDEAISAYAEQYNKETQP